MKSFIKNFIILLITLIQISNLKSQSGWTPPIAANYSFTASVRAVFRLDGILSSNPGDQVAFFYGNEIRGLGNSLANPLGGRIFIVTIYSNAPSQVLSIKVYDAATNQISDAVTTITFVPQSITGTLSNPFQVVAFADNDSPIDLLQIPPQTTMSVFPFQPIALVDYLVQTDNDPIVWSTNANQNLIVNIQNDSLFVSSANGFTGQTILRVKATEQTANQYKDSVDVIFNVNEMYDDPRWVTHPSQGIAQGSSFSNVDLNDFEDGYNGNCLDFDYYPIIEANNSPEPLPVWQAPINLQYNMSVNARVRFTPKYYYYHANDKLAAFINSQLVGVASPTLVNDEVYFFLRVGNSATSGTVSLQFYSGEFQELLEFNTTINFIPNAIVGNITNPYIIDFTPLIPFIDGNDNLQIIINNISWLGEQSFEFTAFDCNYFQILNDTIIGNFCITNNSANLQVYYKDFDNDGHGVGFATTYCDRPLGYKLQSELININDDCEDNEALLNINPAITIDDKCYLTINNAIDDAVLNDIIMVHSSVTSTEDNILPTGIKIQVKNNATWTNNGMLTNRGLIEILGNVRFVNGTSGVYKGTGVLNGGMINYGSLSPGD